jgi:hypothetical protein
VGTHDKVDALKREIEMRLEDHMSSEVAHKSPHKYNNVSISFVLAVEFRVDI